MDDFREWSRRAAGWGADYREHVRDRPVRPRVEPGRIAAQLPRSPPEKPEPMERIFDDFERVIVPGLTHWQHPRFFAYFPANAAPASVVAEQLVAALAVQCMLWQTSPSATELETVALDWFRQALGLPADFQGVIQDTASSATLAAVLTLRERALDWRGNQKGLAGGPRVRVYSSPEGHSSIERAIWFAGIGSENLVRVATKGPARAIDTDALRIAIRKDREAGHLPAGVVALVGGTSVGATDDIRAVADVCESEGLYLHVDAAWAGAAMICPEFRELWSGIDRADSVVINAHKWLGAQPPCSAHFVRDPKSLVRTLALQPEYLKTQGKGAVTNYSEWTPVLGRTFRGLKLWFLFRAYGLEKLRDMIRNHVAWTKALAERIRKEPDFEIVTEPILALFSFRYAPEGARDLDTLNLALVEAINNDGRIYLTQTRVDGRVAIRFIVGGFSTTETDVSSALVPISQLARSMLARS